MKNKCKPLSKEEEYREIKKICSTPEGIKKIVENLQTPEHNDKVDYEEIEKEIKKKVIDNKKHICTTCGGNAFVGWANDTKKDQDYFGGIIKPDERLCLACGKKRGVKYF